MLLYDRPLWFDSCAGHWLVSTALVLIIIGLSIAINLRFRRHGVVIALGLMALGFAAMGPLASIGLLFDPEIVRVRITDRGQQIGLCRGMWRIDREMPSGAVAYRYREDIQGSKRRIYRLAVLAARDEERPIGSIDLDHASIRRDILRQLAPEVVRSHELSTSQAAR